MMCQPQPCPCALIGIQPSLLALRRTVLSGPPAAELGVNPGVSGRSWQILQWPYMTNNIAPGIAAEHRGSVRIVASIGVWDAPVITTVA
jgi:hypothetical protein